MSQYAPMLPPRPYMPPNQDAAAQQPPVYRPGAPNYPQKSEATFGQMMNQRLEQAVDVGKPMFNKLGKTISSKLGNKPSPGPPQHLHNSPNYQSQIGQQYQTQGYQPSPSQNLSPQSQQRPWGQPQHQPPAQASSTQVSPQQSTHQQPNYVSPVSGHPGQSNYFPQQTSQTPSPRPYAPQPPPTHGYNPAQYGHSGSTIAQMHNMNSQPSMPSQQGQRPQNQYTGQQMGAVGRTQSAPSTQSSPIPSASPTTSAQSIQSPWGYQTTTKPSPTASQQQPAMPTSSSRPLQTAPSPVSQQGQQQWNTTSPISPHGQGQMQSPSHSPIPPPPRTTSPLVPLTKPTPPTQPSTPALQHADSFPSPSGFIAELPAELPADIGCPNSQEPDPSSVDSRHYQAFCPSGAQVSSLSTGFTIPRRSISANTSPLADPWRFADPVTEMPTRECYILADLLFDALDRKFEPRNTGLLEAPKILSGWAKVTEDAIRLFSYRSYSAFAKLWSLEGIPHIMVPCQPALTPNWNFSQHTHAQEVKMMTEIPLTTSTYATYMPALNRAGWYKFFFLEMVHAPEDIGDVIPRLCADTYKPDLLNHPDIEKRDKTDVPALQARAAEIQTYALGRVCEETKTAMSVDSDASLG